MKNLILASFVITCLASSVPAQTTTVDSQSLNEQVAALFKNGQFDKAIPLAKKVVDNERQFSHGSEKHALSVMNLGVLYKERFRQSKKKLDGSRQTFSTGEKLYIDARAAEQCFRDALGILAANQLGQSLSGAAVKSELAWILNNYISARALDPIRYRIDEAAILYADVVAIRQKQIGPNSAPALQSLLNLGDFNTRWINYEAALPVYEQYLHIVEKNNGSTAPALVPALRGVLEILVITMQQKEALDVAKRISSITGKTESLPTFLPNLALRSSKLGIVDSPQFAPPLYINDQTGLFAFSAAADKMIPTSSVKITGFQINIVVDEAGNVIEAKANDRYSKTAKAVEPAARSSKFRPFVYNGIAQKMKGTLVFPYIED